MIDFKTIAERLLAGAQDLLPRWLPNGKWQGHEWVVGNLHGDAGDSLKINANSGKWADFASGDAGGDLVSLYAAINGMEQGEAARALEAEVGALPATPAPAKGRVKAAWRGVRNPKTKPPARITHHFKFGEPSRVWEYRDEGGAVIGLVARYDTAPGKKEIVPYTEDEATGKWGGGQWVAPRPLYGLEHLAKHPGAPVLIVEGEKAADAARTVLQGPYVVVTWPGGGTVWDKADWTPVHGRKVLLWPDADTAGTNTMVGYVKDGVSHPGLGVRLAEHCPEVKVLDVTGQPKGWDAADAVADGWDKAATIAWAKPRARLIGSVLEPSPAPVPRETEEPRKPRAREDDAGAKPAQVATPGKSKPTTAERVAPSLFPWEGRAWAAQMLVSDKGIPKPNVANAIRALELDPDWQGVLVHDVFAAQTHAVAPPPIVGPGEGPWTDVHDTRTAEWLQRVGINVGTPIAAAAVEAVAQLASYHPVREYLERCRDAWDGTNRIDHWMTDYCCVEPSAYTVEVGRHFLIGAVARIFKPGCQVDTALIFEGSQGLLKSSAFRALGGEWFSDDMPDLHSKDAQMQVGGVWILELPELSAIGRSELEVQKAFITRRVERFRPPYGRRVIERARQCVFAGTVNPRSALDYLKDDENRRFLPVLVQDVIDTAGIEAVRDQLWGEAVVRYEAGDRWWMIEGEALALAREEQGARKQADPWEVLAREFVRERTALMGPIKYLTVASILRDVVKLPVARWGQIEHNRASRVLQGMGWRKGQIREPDGSRPKVFHNPEWAGDELEKVERQRSIPLTGAHTVDDFE